MVSVFPEYGTGFERKETDIINENDDNGTGFAKKTVTTNNKRMKKAYILKQTLYKFGRHRMRGSFHPSSL